MGQPAQFTNETIKSQRTDSREQQPKQQTKSYLQPITQQVSFPVGNNAPTRGGQLFGASPVKLLGTPADATPFNVTSLNNKMQAPQRHTGGSTTI